MGNIDSRIWLFGFYYCPFLPIGQVGGDFCNSIGQKQTHAPQHRWLMLSPIAGELLRRGEPTFRAGSISV
jgi:hypothetical protein